MKKHLLKLLLLCCVGILALGMYACVPSTEQYKVDFLVDGEVYDSQITDGNSRIAPPSDPSKYGYIFRGWYLDEGEWTNKFHAYSFEKDPIKSDVKIYAYFEYDDAHECDKKWVTELNPTCKTEGRKVYKCSVKACGKVYDTDTIPVSTKHTPMSEPVKTELVHPTCQSDGSYIEVYYCKICNLKLDTPAPKKVTTSKDNNAHDFSNGQLKKEGDKFCFYAECTNKASGNSSACGFKVSISDVEVTEKVIIPATCDSAGSIQYVYTHFGMEFATEAEAVAPLCHKLCGVAINSDTVYSEETYADFFDSITLIASNAGCGDNVVGVFKCENCGENCEINVKKPHVGTWVEVKAATCYAPGDQSLSSCSACGRTDLVRHTLVTDDHVDGEIKLAKFGDEFHVIIPCIHEKDGCVEYKILLEDVRVTSKDVISESCETPDVTRYTYKSEGKTLTYDVVIAEGHFLGDVRASTLQDEAGWFNYRLVGMGISLFANTPLSCNTMTNGMYTCTSCNRDILVDVYRPHNGDWTTVEAATCTSVGSATFDCDYCDFTDTKVLEILEHNYVYELDTVKLDGSNIERFALVGKCSCEAVNIISNVTVNVASSRQPTCTEKGEIVYSCTYEGVTYTHTDEIPVISHSLDGIPTAAGTRLDYYEYVLNGDVKINFDNRYSVTCVLDKNDTSYDLDAKFVCSDCGATVDVKVYRVHNLSEVVKSGTSSSPCIDAGTKHNECTYSDCEYKSTPVAYETVNHVLSATLVNNADGTYTVNVSCTVNGCGYSQAYAGLDAVNVKVEVAADCCTDGIVEYAFNYNGTEYVIKSNVGKGNHVLNGVDYTSLLDDGKLPSNVVEIIFVGEKTFFKCEKCNQLVEVDLK